MIVLARRLHGHQKLADAPLPLTILTLAQKDVLLIGFEPIIEVIFSSFQRGRIVRQRTAIARAAADRATQAMASLEVGCGM